MSPPLWYAVHPVTPSVGVRMSLGVGVGGVEKVNRGRRRGPGRGRECGCLLVWVSAGVALCLVFPHLLEELCRSVNPLPCSGGLVVPPCWERETDRQIDRLRYCLFAVYTSQNKTQALCELSSFALSVYFQCFLYCVLSLLHSPARTSPPQLLGIFSGLFKCLFSSSACNKEINSSLYMISYPLSVLTYVYFSVPAELTFSSRAPPFQPSVV